MIVIYHNPNCTMTKKCLKILETDSLGQFDVKHHNLSIQPDRLKEILRMLNCKPLDLIKKSHFMWKSLLKHLKFTDDELLDILYEYPGLLKSPIIINGDKAIIGRPPERILDIIK